MAQAAREVRFTPTALKDYERLDGSQVRLVERALERIASDPQRGKPLSGEFAGLFSERTASLRIIYLPLDQPVVVAVVAIGHRSHVYADLARRRARLARELAELETALSRGR